MACGSRTGRDRYRGAMAANPASMPNVRSRRRRTGTLKHPQSDLDVDQVPFRDTTTGDTGVMRQRSSDKVFEFYPDEGMPRAVTEPGRYRRART